jgi:CxxC-x17-CxxC domain-containing protein
LPANQTSITRDHETHEDKLVNCVDCGNDFVFTAGEQLSSRKQLHRHPRCFEASKLKPSGGSDVRAETRTICSVRGQQTTVPFHPTQERTILRDCAQSRRLSECQNKATVSAHADGVGIFDIDPKGLRELSRVSRSLAGIAATSCAVA